MTMLIKKFDVDYEKLFKADKPGEGSAVIAQFDVIDKDNDVTLPGAFGEQHVNMLPAHDRMAPRLGKAILKEAGDLAVAEFKFNLDPAAVTAREWHSALKFDAQNGQPLQEWSYGFEIVKFSFGQHEGKDVRFLEKLKVFEISPVLRGAGVGTQTLSIKSDNNMTLKQEMENALTSLADITHVVTRAKSLAGLREDEGRQLSESHQESVRKLYESLAGSMEVCKNLIDGLKEKALPVGNLAASYEQILFEYKHLIKD